MSQGFTKDYLVKATGETKVFVNGVVQASTSGSTIDFTIPSGVKRFSVSLDGVSTDSTYQWGFRLGDSGGVETTGYDAQGWFVQTASQGLANYTDRFGLRSGSAGNLLKGVYEFILHDAATNTWCMYGGSGATSSSSGFSASGSKALSSELTTLQLYTTGTFDSGSVNVQYENPDLAVSYNGTVPAGVTDVFVNGVKQASTSGTEIDFTIPAGVKEFKLCLDQVDTSTTTYMLIQLGDSGGIEATGYEGATARMGTGVASVSPTTGFGVYASGTGETASGVITFVLLDAATNQWVCSGVTSDDAPISYVTSGSKTLSGELTTVRLIATSSGTFEGGSVNVQYENQDLDLGSGVISGGVVQTVHTQTGEVSTGTTILPNDNTIPQNTEGNEVMTASITPTDAANKLKIEVVMHGSHSTTAQHMSAALFQDSTAGALAAMQSAKDGGGSATGSVVFTHWMTAGTTSSTTFKVRGGTSGGATFSFNGNSGTRKFGGVMASSITITEYKV
jgi:hypothetical protein